MACSLDVSIVIRRSGMDATSFKDKIFARDLVFTCTFSGNSFKSAFSLNVLVPPWVVTVSISLLLQVLMLVTRSVFAIVLSVEQVSSKIHESGMICFSSFPFCAKLTPNCRSPVPVFPCSVGQFPR